MMWVGTALLVVGTCVALAAGLRAWLLRAFRIPDRSWVDDPGRLGCDAGEPVWVRTRRGRRLHVLRYLSHPGAPVVVMLHGWGANASHLLFMVPRILAEGWNAVVFDARCHGLSEDDGFASLPRFAEDAEAVLKDLRREGWRDFILLGHSVGAGAALLAASRTPGIRAVISLAAFSHPEPVMDQWLRGRGIPLRPAGWLIKRAVEGFIGHRFDTIAPRTTIRRIQAPVLLVHGLGDTVVPPWHARVLARARPGTRLMCLPGVGHNDPPGFANHVDAILAWLRPHAALGPDPSRPEPSRVTGTD
ncbi:MAG: alpha/beta hydrolase [Ectothiorhodospira sp.]